MRFLERTAERLQLENDNLKAELAERDQRYQELMADFEMTEDFRCQVENENSLLKAQVTNLTNLLEEALDNLEEAVNDADRLEAVNYDLKCDLAEARTDLTAAENKHIAIQHIVDSLKADGVIPQYVVTNGTRLGYANQIIDHLESY